jgi:exosortase A-associated hydrolase 1/exosortase A-associated hydrolase 2
MLIVQPFAEESNRCRYMWPQLASQLGDIDTFVLDGWGCGDSAGDFSEASIARWRTELLLFIQQLQQLGYRELRFLAVRFGALQLLDLLSFGPLPLPVSQVLLWQPQLQSHAFLTQWLRLKQANLNNNPATDSPKALRAQLAQGLAIDIAGYALTPTFYQELAQLQPRLAPCYSALRVDCIYSQPPQAAAMKTFATAAPPTSSLASGHHHRSFAHPSDPIRAGSSHARSAPMTPNAENPMAATELPPALAAPLADLNAYLATPVTCHVITGAPYWMQSERVDISALLALSVQLLQTYRPAMPQQTKTDSVGSGLNADTAPSHQINSMAALGVAVTERCSVSPTKSPYTTKPPAAYQQQLWTFDVAPNNTASDTTSNAAGHTKAATSRGKESVLALDTSPTPVDPASPCKPIGPPLPTDTPIAKSQLGVLILVGGHQYRVGAHRQFTLLSRHLAQHGFCSLRIDVPGMGDNSGQLSEFYQHDIYIKTALDRWQQQQPQLQHFVIWGLCDAASSALIYQCRYHDARLVGLVLLNPWLRQPQQQAQVMLQNYYGQKLTDRQWWLKLLRGQVHIRQSVQEVVKTWWQSRTPSRVSAKDTGKPLSQQPIKPPVTADNYVQVMYEGWHSFSGNTLVLLSGADFTAQEFLLYCEQQPTWQALLRQAELHTLADANHTFARADWRAWVEQQTVTFLQQLTASNR